MSRWISETTELESKEQLKAHRKHMWLGLLLSNGLDEDLIPFWTQAEKDLELELWAKADANYENRKVVLKRQLEALDSKELGVYFSEIGVEVQDITKWLKVEDKADVGIS